MFGKKNESAGSQIYDTLIGRSSVFEGNIISEGTVRVDGRVKGDMRISGDLYIGDDASVTGNIFANNVEMSGTVEGNVNARGVLRIMSTARLYGDIQVHSFMAEEGGMFQGRCSMADSSEAENNASKGSSRKAHASRDYKKSSIIDQTFDDTAKDGNA